MSLKAVFLIESYAGYYTSYNILKIAPSVHELHMLKVEQILNMPKPDQNLIFTAKYSSTSKSIQMSSIFSLTMCPSIRLVTGVNKNSSKILFDGHKWVNML